MVACSWEWQSALHLVAGSQDEWGVLFPSFIFLALVSRWSLGDKIRL